MNGAQGTRRRDSLPAERSWTFRTADGNWQTPRQLEAASAYALDPDIAVDTKGQAVAVWRAMDASGEYEVRSVIYVPGSGWGNVVTVSTPNGWGLEPPKVRLDGQGNGMAVWQQVSGPSGFAC